MEYGENKGHLYGTSFDSIDEVLKHGRMCIVDAESHVCSVAEPVDSFTATPFLLDVHFFVLFSEYSTFTNKEAEAVCDLH